MMAAEVTISIVGRPYEIACDEGQEAAVTALAREVDGRAQALLRAVGQVGDARLLVMVALLMAEEIGELSARVKDLEADGGGASKAEIEAAAQAAAASARAEIAGKARTADQELARGLDTLIRRLEAILAETGGKPA